jgi:hypothetical protein
MDRRVLDKYSQAHKAIEQSRDVAAARKEAKEVAAHSLTTWDLNRQHYEALSRVLSRHKYKYSSKLEQDLQREVDDDELR